MGGHNAEGGGAVDNNGPGVGSHWRGALVDLSVSGSFEEMRVRAQSRQMQIQNTQKKTKRDKRYDSIIVASFVHYLMVTRNHRRTVLKAAMMVTKG